MAAPIMWPTLLRVFISWQIRRTERLDKGASGNLLKGAGGDRLYAGLLLETMVPVAGGVKYI